MLVGHAQVNLTDGTEIIVTDENSEVILGHGTVMSGQVDLTLNMEGDSLADSMVVLFISPDGTFVTLRGYIGADNNFWLTDEDNSQLTNLASLSRDANLNLAISGTAATAFAASDTPDDDLLRDPNQVAQPALGVTPATQPRQSRFAFGESDSDDRDRRVVNTGTDPTLTDNEDAVASPPPSQEPDPPTSPDLPRDDAPSDNFGEPNEDGESNGGGGGDSPDVVDSGNDGDEPDSPEVSNPEPDDSNGGDSGDDDSDNDSAGTEDNDADNNDDTNSDDDSDDTNSDEDDESAPNDANESEDGAGQ